VADLVDGCCARATRFGAALSEIDGVTIGNDIVPNQVLVRFGDDDAQTDRVIADVQLEGTAWMGGTTWRGRRYMRISVSNWQTTDEEVDRTVATIRKVFSAR
jgi:glutamate/tyrosine decarboxylase-like PLP-dependent enzyme